MTFEGEWERFLNTGPLRDNLALFKPDTLAALKATFAAGAFSGISLTAQFVGRHIFVALERDIDAMKLAASGGST